LSKLKKVKVTSKEGLLTVESLESSVRASCVMFDDFFRIINECSYNAYFILSVSLGGGKIIRRQDTRS